ncbi:unnamed protein product [Dibothriocephalus latus]|uniref:Uncharacterized protein n=1 Tax=Dibothriocephalus latus TaxID=60516 RepID=A0A3P7LA51_DIBLA|nr:unnamed protein product [Dibothriocephalus latus]
MMPPLSPKAYLPAALSNWDFSKKEWSNGEAAGDEGVHSGSSGDKIPSRRGFGYEERIGWSHSECFV